jgi:hypothetical protein
MPPRICFEWNATVLVPALLLFACLATPIWLFQYVPLVDYPNHLARMEILAFYDRTPYLQQVYVHDQRLLPDLAMDLVVPFLRGHLSLAVSGKIFLTGLLLLYCLGTVVLAAVLHGRLTLRAVLLWPTFYNSALLWGFLNYITGVCLFLLWAALLIYTLNYEVRTPRILHYALLLAGAVACYIAHLTAFGMCCITWGMLVLYFLVVERRVGIWLLLCGATLVVPVLLYAHLLISGNVEAYPAAHAIVYDWREKILQLLDFTRGYNWVQDLLPTLLLLSAFGYCCARASARPWISSALWPALGLFAAYIILPKAASASTGSAFDVRFYWPASLFLVFALPATGWSAREKAIIATVTSLAWALRLAELSANWNVLSRASGEMVEVLDQVPEGARIYPICGTSANADTEKQIMALCHVLEYEIPRRRIFDPALFATPGAQPILFRSPIGHWKIRPIEQFNRYDYVWSAEPKADVEQYLETHAYRVGTASGYVLWHLQKDLKASER